MYQCGFSNKLSEEASEELSNMLLLLFYISKSIQYLSTNLRIGSGKSSTQEQMPGGIQVSHNAIP